MTADVRQLLEAAPFEPFYIVTSAGKRYKIPSADHAGMHPKGRGVVIWFDDGGSVTISALHIAAIEKKAAKKNGNS